MTITPSTFFKLTDQQISSDLDGEKVILNHRKGAYYGLNEVGALVWNELEQGAKSFKDLMTTVAEVYDTQQEELLEDLSELMNKLLSEKLAEVVG